MNSKFLFIDIPYNKDLSYTLFSQGFTFDIPQYIDDNNYVRFKYPKNTVFILFYEFKTSFKLKTRRAYVLTCPIKKAVNKISLPGVSEEVQLIYQARGKKVDLLKHMIFFLTQNNKYLIYKMPVIFWYKITSMIEFYKGSKIDFINLFNMYRPKNYKELKIDNI